MIFFAEIGKGPLCSCRHLVGVQKGGSNHSCRAFKLYWFWLLAGDRIFN